MGREDTATVREAYFQNGGFSVLCLMLFAFHLPPLGLLKEPGPGFVRFYIVIINVEFLHWAPTFGCTFLDLFLKACKQEPPI